MPEILDLLRDCEERRFAAGEVILEQGGTGGHLLFLVEGAVEVVMDGAQIATTSQPGSVFGVFSLLSEVRDMATIRAHQSCLFRVVENPRAFLQNSPLVCWHVCETITHRLATLSAYLSDAQRQLAGHDHLSMMTDVLATLLHRQPKPCALAPASQRSARARWRSDFPSLEIHSAVIASRSSRIYVGTSPICRPGFSTHVFPTRSIHDPSGRKGAR